MVTDLEIAEDGASIISDPKDEDDDGLNEILHHGRRSIYDQLEFYVLELLLLSLVLLVFHEDSSFALVIILLDPVILRHVLQKSSFYLLILFVDWN